MKVHRWQHWVIALLGVWMLISHLVLRYAGIHSDALWNTWLVGAAIILVSAGRLIVELPDPWQDGTHAALGFWLMISPWVLGFSSHMPARTNSIMVGFLVAVLALWAMVVDTDLRKSMDAWMHEHHLLR